MPLNRVEQGHYYTGCFVAACATVLQTSYDEAFKLIWPGKDINDPIHAIEAIDIQKAAFEKLKELGLNPKRSKRTKLSKLHRAAIFLIRWSWDITQLHTVVWDAEARVCLDPAYQRPLKKKTYEKQLECIFYVEPRKHVRSGSSETLVGNGGESHRQVTARDGGYDPSLARGG